jgi:hypothetical protein
MAAEWNFLADEIEDNPRVAGASEHFTAGTPSLRDYDEYRGQAAHCAEMAQTVTNTDIRGKWLRMAIDWIGMIPPSRRTQEDAESVRKWTAAH